MYWQDPLIECLASARASRGGWGYRASHTLSAETTALAALALNGRAGLTDVVTHALRALTELQQRDGSVPPSAGLAGPGWATSLAVLAWCMHDESRREFQSEIERAVAWLTDQRGEPIPPRPDVFGHDTTICAWPWVDGTHSWVEPTAYALMALRAAGRSDHPRVRDGVRLLLDRAVPDGGWNYGNVRVLDGLLRPFPATTGIALAALRGEARDSRVEDAVAYLHNALVRIRAPFSLGWGLIGLSAWDAAPFEAEMWLADCAERMLDRCARTVSARLVSDAPPADGQGDPTGSSAPMTFGPALDVTGCALLLLADRPNTLIGKVSRPNP